MNARAIGTVIWKDLKVVSQNKGLILPGTILFVVAFVILPWVVVQLPLLFESTGVAGDILNDIKWLIDLMTIGNQQEFAAYDQYQRWILYLLVYMMAPLFLILPLFVSNTIAADSFVGEKERKTMEALLYTPTTDRELFVAKLLSSWLAACAVALVGFVLYAIMVNWAAWSEMHRVFFPNAMWLVLIFWVAPAVPGLGLGIVVMVSARAQSFQDATQTGGFIVLPIMMLTAGMMSGVMSFSVAVMFLVGLVIWLLDGLLIWLGSRSFRRGRMLGA